MNWGGSKLVHRHGCSSVRLISRDWKNSRDEPVPYFSFWQDDLFHVEHSGVNPEDIGHSEGKYPPGSVLDRLNGQLHCWMSETNEKTAEIIRENLHKSPMYSGQIEGVGPRYCPSIEDKIVRFADKPTHQIFIEPEGIATDELYINGFSTCLPFEVQYEMVRTIRGCENAEILRRRMRWNMIIRRRVSCIHP